MLKLSGMFRGMLKKDQKGPANLTINRCPSPTLIKILKKSFCSKSSKSPIALSLGKGYVWAWVLPKRLKALKWNCSKYRWGYRTNSKKLCAFRLLKGRISDIVGTAKNVKLKLSGVLLLLMLWLLVAASATSCDCNYMWQLLRLLATASSCNRDCWISLKNSTC